MSVGYLSYPFVVMYSSSNSIIRFRSCGIVSFGCFVLSGTQHSFSIRFDLFSFVPFDVSLLPGTVLLDSVNSGN